MVKDNTIKQLDLGNHSDKDKDIIKVLISIPNEGHTLAEAYANRMTNMIHMGRVEGIGMAKNLKPRFEFYSTTVARMLTPLAREEAAKMALEHSMDYLFMIDDDMSCPDDLFERLWRHDVDIVAPLAFTRNYPHKAVLYKIEEGFDNVTQTPYFINHWIHKYPRNKLVECDAVGFGAVLIKRKVLEDMKEPRFMSTNATGEDILFCHKARKLGFKVFMDTSTKLGHFSHPVEITEEYVDRVHADKKDDFEKEYADYDENLTHEPKPVPDIILGE